jgi:hypothetical protein
MPKPPGNGLQIRPREPHPLHLSACLRKASFEERVSISYTYRDKSQHQRDNNFSLPCRAGRAWTERSEIQKSQTPAPKMSAREFTSVDSATNDDC